MNINVIATALAVLALSFVVTYKSGAIEEKRFVQGPDYAKSVYATNPPYRGYGQQAGYGQCRGGCCSTPGQGAQGTSSGVQAAYEKQKAQRIKVLEGQVLSYYASKFGSSDVNVEVKDFGCHQEAYISKDGKVIKKFSINGNNIYEI